MRLTIKEPDINIGVDGFNDHCQLERAETGKKLSELVEKIEDPIVIALDGSWGSGKSFFLKCWTGAHTNENDGKAKVIYFDAFQHDFLDDPLIALTGVLADQFDPKSKAGKAIGLAKKAVSKMWRPAARIGLAAATAGTSEMAGAVGDAAIATSSNELNKASENFWKKEDGRRAAMGEFRTALEELTEQDKGGTPQKIVIIIDELDRCRPDYALTMLEVIKHFFAVDNVHFVLGVNLKELQNSVMARYGAKVDAGNYLRKFITLTMELPALIGEFEKTEVGFYYFNLAAHELGISKKITESVREYLNSLRNSTPLSIREMQKLLSILVLIPTTTKGTKTDNIYWGTLSSIAGLAMLKCFYPQLYKKALVNQLAYEDIASIFSFFGPDGEASDPYQQEVWAEILDPSRKVNDTSSTGSNPFGPFGLRRQENWLANIAEDFLETFELLEVIPQE